MRAIDADDLKTAFPACDNSKSVLIASVRATINHMPTIEPEPPWVPVTERLPEEDGDYWVTVDPRHVPPGYRSTDMITWRDGKWLMADYFVLDGEGLKKPEYKVVEAPLPVIAWMPPPEPYKGGKYQ